MNEKEIILKHCDSDIRGDVVCCVCEQLTKIYSKVYYAVYRVYGTQVIEMKGFACKSCYEASLNQIPMAVKKEGENKPE
jgi:predicted  nucleic acid-binding Zn ribbon protein